LSDDLCSAFRPSHFRSVTTVVHRLLLWSRPTWRFSVKDYQQLMLIRLIVADLGIPVGSSAWTRCATDGHSPEFAQQLSERLERRTAPQLYKPLRCATRCCGGSLTKEAEEAAMGRSNPVSGDYSACASERSGRATARMPVGAVGGRVARRT
jgi:pantoate--beta-alanine ligase